MPSLADLGKVLIIFGLFSIILGGSLLLLGKIPGFGRLPGDIYLQKDNFTFYFPLVTFFLLSIIVSIILNLLFRR